MRPAGNHGQGIVDLVSYARRHRTYRRQLGALYQLRLGFFQLREARVQLVGKISLLCDFLNAASESVVRHCKWRRQQKQPPPGEVHQLGAYQTKDEQAAGQYRLEQPYLPPSLQEVVPLDEGYHAEQQADVGHMHDQTRSHSRHYGLGCEQSCPRTALEAPEDYSTCCGHCTADTKVESGHFGWGF